MLILNCLQIGRRYVLFCKGQQYGRTNNSVLAGIRVSLYNAVTEEQTDKLVAFMNEFIAEETKNKQQ